jgi:hypothetical protein
MPLYWLCYRPNNQISVVIEPGASLIHARACCPCRIGLIASGEAGAAAEDTADNKNGRDDRYGQADAPTTAQQSATELD